MSKTERDLKTDSSLAAPQELVELTAHEFEAVSGGATAIEYGLLDPSPDPP